MKPSILLVDDEPTTLLFYTRHLRSLGYDVIEAASLSAARAAVNRQQFNAVLLDLNLPDGNGIDWIPELRERCPAVSVQVMTGAGDISVAVDAMRRGADNFLTKPVDMDEVDVFVRKGLEISSLRRREASHRRLLKPVQPYFGESPSMREVREMVTVAADNDAPILLQGETGTGKGVLARWIHDHGNSPGAPFVEVNCSTLRGDLLSSELFGHTRGAFTSAVKDRVGLIEVADGGTLFLDEIGDMDLPVQAQFLKVVEEKSYRRLGEVDLRHSEFRLICASNRDLAREVSKGSFREDLLFRINVFPIILPSLASRPEDLPQLIRHILAGINPSIEEIPADILAMLTKYSWPGNIREMKNVLERALLLCRGAPLERRHFPGIETSGEPTPGPLDLSEFKSLEELEQKYIKTVLAQVDNDVGKACGILGISRATLYRKLKSSQQEEEA